MSVRSSHRAAKRGASVLERQTAIESSFASVGQRVRALEGGRSRGPGSSFGLPFTFVGPSGAWTFDEAPDGLSIVVNHGATPVLPPGGPTPPPGPPVTIGLNADFLDGFDSSYFLDFNNLNNRPDFAGLYVDVSGDTMTGPLVMENTWVTFADTSGLGTEWNVVNDDGTLRFVLDGVDRVRFGTTGDVLMDGRLSVGDEVTDDNFGGVYWDGVDPLYGIYRTPGAWVPGTGQQMRINWPQGIQIGAGTGVGAGDANSYVEVLSGKGLYVTSGTLRVTSGGHGSEVTPFYLDGDGNFSVFDKLIFESGLNTPDGFASLTVIGRIRGAIDNVPVVPTDSNTFYIGSIVVSSVGIESTLALADGVTELGLASGDVLGMGALTSVEQEAVVQTLDTAGALIAHTFLVGDTVILYGIPGTAAALEGAWIVTAKTTNTFTIRSQPNAPFVGIANATYTAANNSFTTTGTGASGQAEVVVASVTGIKVGQYVAAVGVPVGAQVMTIDAAALRIKLNANLTGTLTATSMKFYASARVRELTLGLHKALNGSPAGLGLRIDESNYWFVNNHFRVGTAVSYFNWDGTTLKTSGTIDALAGNFVGKMTVNNGTMAFGTRVDPAQLFNGIYITANDFWYSTGAFRIGGANGIAYAGSGNITVGTGVVVSGPISGSTIDIGGADATSFHVDATGNAWLGNATFAGAPLTLSSAGVLTATGAVISGAITGGTIDIGGADATSFHVDVNGNAWLGAATLATAPLRLINNGELQLVGTSNTMKLYVTGAVPVIEFSGAGLVTAASGPLLLGASTSVTIGSGGVADDITFTTGGFSRAFIDNVQASFSVPIFTTAVTSTGVVQGTIGLFYTTDFNDVAFNLQNVIAANTVPTVDTNAGFTAWLSGTAAPIWKCRRSVGEAWLARNSSDTGYIGIFAGAFTVVSSRAFKTNVEPADIESVLDRAGGLRLHAYDPRVKPKMVRPTAKVRRAATRRGVAAAEVVTSALDEESVDHDCSVASCGGTRQAPCNIVTNDTTQFGLIAEDIHAVMPEWSRTDADGSVIGYDLNQMAATTFAGLLAMRRRLAELEREVERLQAKLQPA